MIAMCVRGWIMAVWNCKLLELCKSSLGINLFSVQADDEEISFFTRRLRAMIRCLWQTPDLVSTALN